MLKLKGGGGGALCFFFLCLLKYVPVRFTYETRARREVLLHKSAFFFFFLSWGFGSGGGDKKSLENMEGPYRLVEKNNLAYDYPSQFVFVLFRGEEEDAAFGFTGLGGGGGGEWLYPAWETPALKSEIVVIVVV